MDVHGDPHPPAPRPRPLPAPAAGRQRLTVCAGRIGCASVRWRRPCRTLVSLRSSTPSGPDQISISFRPWESVLLPGGRGGRAQRLDSAIPNRNLHALGNLKSLRRRPPSFDTYAAARARRIPPRRSPYAGDDNNSDPRRSRPRFALARRVKNLWITGVKPFRHTGKRKSYPQFSPPYPHLIHRPFWLVWNPHRRTGRALARSSCCPSQELSPKNGRSTTILPRSVNSRSGPPALWKTFISPPVTPPPKP